jgi:cyanophycinase-like exopeptidase
MTKTLPDGTVENVYTWFLRQANFGNVVVIGNGAHDVQDIAHDFYQVYGHARSVDVFCFNVNSSAQLNAPDIVADINADGEQLGHEFLDKLRGAEAVFFMSGDQWPYVQLLRPNGSAGGNKAAQIISSGNNAGTVTVGGTSAGLAILGNYVFTAEWIRHESLYSVDILNDYYTPKFYNNGPSIANDVFSFNMLSSVLTETHFTDPLKSLEGETYFRLPRFLSFLAAVLLPAPAGLGGSSVKGIAVDQDTALAIDRIGLTRVYGEGNVYFAKANTIASLVPNGPNQAYVLMSGVYIRWYDVDAEQFYLSTAWNDAPEGEGYAIYGLGGDGSFIRTGGHLPLPFPPNE